MVTTRNSGVVEAINAEAVNSKENRKLYAARKKIFPKRVAGYFRRLKWWIMGLTLAIYYVTPWLRWDRGPFAPDQAVLVDLANRRFYFFPIEIWPQEFFYVAGLLVMAGVGLFLVTSTVGRAWCGYACPQTVWVDLFLVVERAIEGDRNARMKLETADWTPGKIGKRLLKHAIWLLISVSTGGAWIFYFADAPGLLQDLLAGNAAFAAYATVAVLTATTYLFGGMMREQVCTYMCPWPRIQAAMLDEDSLTVTYNEWRGEPRSRHLKKVRAAGALAGDCVDCNACVAACPMGIDIREGQQLECITCALCIDACDSVMDKLGKERGLISYTTLTGYNANMLAAGATVDPATVGKFVISDVDPAKVRPDNGPLSDKFASTTLRSVVRPRTLAYALIWSAIGLALFITLMLRDRLDVSVLHDRNPVFVRLSDGSVRNGYEIKILNMIPELRVFSISVDGLPGAAMKQADSNATGARQITVSIKPDQLRSFKVFIQVPRDAVTSTHQPFNFIVKEVDGEEQAIHAAKFVSPGEHG